MLAILISTSRTHTNMRTIPSSPGATPPAPPLKLGQTSLAVMSNI